VRPARRALTLKCAGEENGLYYLPAVPLRYNCISPSAGLRLLLLATVKMCREWLIDCTDSHLEGTWDARGGEASSGLRGNQYTPVIVYKINYG